VVLFSGPGRLSPSFSHFLTPIVNLIGLRFQTSILLLCMRTGRKSSSPRKEFQFFIPNPFQVLTVSQIRKVQAGGKVSS
jgi:hypothetical protein